MHFLKLIDLLNGDLINEYKHMLFYTHAANMLIGMERLYLADKLKEHAASEMQHVFQFAQKIHSNGLTPNYGFEIPGIEDFPIGAKDILNMAIKLEEEVVHNYHVRHQQASELHAETGKHYDLVIFLEEQIEHSQGDIDELKLIVPSF